MPLPFICDRHARCVTTLFLILVICLLTTACGQAPIDPTVTPTLPPTDTPVPTGTPQPTPTSTRTPRPTPNWTATKNAEKTATQEAILEEIAKDLDVAGYRLEDGKLIWRAKEPMYFNLDRPWTVQYFLIPKDPQRNFIVMADVTWDTTYGTSGCGIMFSAKDDLKNDGYYLFNLMRQQHAPVWYIERLRYGRSDLMLTHYENSDLIQDGPGSSNKILLVVDGPKISAYANGEYLGMVEYGELDEGKIGFEAWEDSGQTLCIYTDAWLFALND